MKTFDIIGMTEIELMDVLVCISVVTRLTEGVGGDPQVVKRLDETAEKLFNVAEKYGLADRTRGDFKHGPADAAVQHESVSSVAFR